MKILDFDCPKFRLTDVARRLALLLFLTLSVAAQGQTTTGTTANGVVYSASNGQVAITGYSGTGGAVSIPSPITVSGSSLPVTSIGTAAFMNAYSLTSLTIPSGVTSIGADAFEDCLALTSVTIPSSVTSIGDYAWADCSGLTSLTILSGVTTIGTYAFGSCSKLTNVTIPASVTSIGNEAFAACTNLTSITVAGPNSFFTSVNGVLFNSGTTALIQCPAGMVGSYTIPNSVTNIVYGAFLGCNKLTSVTIPSSVNSIGAYAFEDCNKLTSVAIPVGVTSIGTFTFASCSLLSSVTIPFGVTSIGSNAFWVCSSLTSVTIPASVTSIGREAFDACSKLTSVTIPASVSSIGNQAFDGCNSLTSITVAAQNSAYSSVNGVLFNNNQTTLIQYPVGMAGSYAIPGTVTSIADSAFSGSYLTSVTIPASVTSIGNSAFDGCSDLTSVTIPVGVKTIGSFAFFGCDSLTGVTIPVGVTNIGSYAFSGCIFLTSVTIPASVTSIGDSAFYKCYLLNRAVFMGNAPSMGSSVFASIGGGFTVEYMSSAKGFTTPTWDGFPAQVYLPPTITTASPLTSGTIGVAYSLAFTATGGIGGYAWAVVSGTLPPGLSINSMGLLSGTPTTVSTSNFTIQVTDGLGTTASQNMSLGIYPNYPFTYTTTSGQITITGYTGSGGVVGIPSAMTVSVSGSSLPVTSIGANAFYNCATLTSVTIPSGVTSIGDGAFWGCTGLSGVTIPASVTSIGNSAFYNCATLTSVTIPSGVTSIGVQAFYGCTRLTGLTIPNSVTSIGTAAFMGCTGLTRVTIPASVTSIRGSAFANCSSLTSAVFMGKSPSMGSNVFPSSGFTVYYFNGLSGFTSPTWYGYPAVNMGASTPVVLWLISNGFAYNASLQSAPNNDGVPLLTAYALNFDPTLNQSDSMPQPVISGSEMSLTYYAGSAGVTYSVETSTDLVNWSTAGVTTSALDANGICTATVPMADPRRFLRLRVSY